MSATMDLSRLTRPAILCQCSRCSSSLAALENEWAKLSNSYSIAAGWLSVELHRISVSSEKKQIPQSSELSRLRGRILQEVSCKLCQQKLGALCALDNGPNIFWKLSKVSFREIVTMRTVEPTFKDGALERLICPPQEQRRDRALFQPGALVPTGSTELESHGISVEQQIQHQGLSLDHISSSVSNLHDTMFELKHAFTALRIELNGPGRFGPDMNSPASKDLMIATVLKELRSKSEEIERLKLEIEALKLKNRYVEEQQSARQQEQLPPSLPILTVGEMLSEVRSPGLLQGSRKRPWPDSFPSGRTQPIGDSFDDDDDDESIGDFALDGRVTIPAVKIPLKDPPLRNSETVHTTDTTTREPSPSGSARLRIEVSQSRHQTPHRDHNMDGSLEASTNSQPREPVLKRPRLAQPADKNSTSARKAGRPRKSFSQTTKPDIFSHTKPAPLVEQNTNNINGANNPKETASLAATSPSVPAPVQEPRRTRSRSLRRRQSANNLFSAPGQSLPNGHVNGETFNTTELNPPSAGKENPPVAMNDVQATDTSEKRKAQTAARDVMVRLAMQREEAMETDTSR
ncbi:hypothetical protein ASPACDRAFT_80493 [Aspergillus aculeatus ATCC 16872]|uniref:Uncharacterized protein n=1 Tax=Aspergillus aculeatus (strain ATCC 16872 / CBS 172.66 / WB 5094) TaxID=690307 RepID=A0A1L9WNI6_ASPA1|nr:uncharacterized protein ASPACDRAFT_80493 [Aspergillus aculeatus ATCC 16872]OJJ97739.1 hypothetical protein ASPACDRAFT_80493 [Aspergillus aculeatus ATCC 16872]